MVRDLTSYSEEQREESVKPWDWRSTFSKLWFIVRVNCLTREDNLWSMVNPDPRDWDDSEKVYLRNFPIIYNKINEYYHPELHKQNNLSENHMKKLYHESFGREFYKPRLFFNITIMVDHLDGKITLTNIELRKLWKEIFISMDLDGRWAGGQTRFMIQPKKPARIIFDIVVAIMFLWFFHQMYLLSKKPMPDTKEEVTITKTMPAKEKLHKPVKSTKHNPIKQANR